MSTNLLSFGYAGRSSTVTFGDRNSDEARALVSTSCAGNGRAVAKYKTILIEDKAGKRAMLPAQAAFVLTTWSIPFS